EWLSLQADAFRGHGLSLLGRKITSCGVFGHVLFPQESPPYVTAIRVKFLEFYRSYMLNVRIFINKPIYEIELYERKYEHKEIGIEGDECGPLFATNVIRSDW